MDKKFWDQSDPAVDWPRTEPRTGMDWFKLLTVIIAVLCIYC